MFDVWLLVLGYRAMERRLMLSRSLRCQDPTGEREKGRTIVFLHFSRVIFTVKVVQ
jgi:hypothetical protein